MKHIIHLTHITQIIQITLITHMLHRQNTHYTHIVHKNKLINISMIEVSSGAGTYNQYILDGYLSPFLIFRMRIFKIKINQLALV